MAGNTMKVIQTIDDRDIVQAFKKQAQLLDKIERSCDWRTAARTNEQH